MVSGTVTARFAYEMPATVRLETRIVGLPPASATPAPPPRAKLAPETALARQKHLKEALEDDMFVF